MPGNDCDPSARSPLRCMCSPLSTGATFEMLTAFIADIAPVTAPIVAQDGTQDPSRDPAEDDVRDPEWEGDDPSWNRRRSRRRHRRQEPARDERPRKTRGGVEIGLNLAGGGTSWQGDVLAYGGLSLGLRLFNVVT